jgi:metal transporter CNNM
MSLYFILEQYHLGVVVEYDNTSEKDPRARAVGIVTLEDIIEEMIQEEIVDETDVFSKEINDIFRRKKI